MSYWFSVLWTSIFEVSWDNFCCWRPVQLVTQLDGTSFSSSDATFPPKRSLVDKFRYRTDTANPPVVAELSLYPSDPAMLSKLGFPINSFHQRDNLSQFVFVTAADKNYFYIDMDAIARIQKFFPNRSIYFYDLTTGTNDYQNDKVSSSCAYNCVTRSIWKILGPFATPLHCHSPGVATVARRHCRTPPAHRCPQRRRRQQRQRVTKGTAMAP